MGRTPRVNVGGLVYHALNRGNAGARVFEEPGDYDAFEQVVCEAYQEVPMRILSYTLMPTHWHFVVWPQEDGQLSDFFHWLTLTHTRRWHGYRRNVGTGHLYQGRFKSIVVQEDAHLLTACRYVERNPLRAGLADRAEDWRWGSLWHRLHGRPDLAPPLAQWPVPQPENWSAWVDQPITQGELDDLRGCINRGRPFGTEHWSSAVVRRFGLQSAIRLRGRPRTKPHA